jgi:hypothetical protein
MRPLKLFDVACYDFVVLPGQFAAGADCAIQTHGYTAGTVAGLLPQQGAGFSIHILLSMRTICCSAVCL